MLLTRVFARKLKPKYVWYVVEIIRGILKQQVTNFVFHASLPDSPAFCCLIRPPQDLCQMSGWLHGAIFEKKNSKPQTCQGNIFPFFFRNKISLTLKDTAAKF